MRITWFNVGRNQRGMKKESIATNHNPRTEYVMPPGEEIGRKPLKDSVFEEMTFINILYAIHQSLIIF
jgi:hypothetical protein